MRSLTSVREELPPHDPADHGFTLVSNYAHYFWRPYLGNTAFSLWELLLSFCHGEVDTAYPSISRLARMLTNSDHSRAVVTGRATAGGGVQRGALNVLRHEGLVQVRRHGSGPTVHYSYRIQKRLPLLTAEQVATLSPTLQLDHRNWLARHGLIPDGEDCDVSPPQGERLERHGINEVEPGRDVSLPQGERLERHGLISDEGDGSVSLRAGERLERHGFIAATAVIATDSQPGAASRTSGHAPCIAGAAPDTAAVDGHGTNHTDLTRTINEWWAEALNNLQADVPVNTYRTVLMSLKPEGREGNALLLRAPSASVALTLQVRLMRLVVQALVEASAGQLSDVRVLGPNR